MCGRKCHPLWLNLVVAKYNVPVLRVPSRVMKSVPIVLRRKITITKHSHRVANNSKGNELCVLGSDFWTSKMSYEIMYFCVPHEHGSRGVMYETTMPSRRCGSQTRLIQKRRWDDQHVTFFKERVTDRSKIELCKHMYNIVMPRCSALS